MEAAANLRVLELAQVTVDVEDEAVELVAVRLLVHAEVAVQLGAHQQIPDPGPDGRQLGRVEGGHVSVLVEEVLEAGQVVVDVGSRHRRQKVVDDHGVGPALGLGPLAGVVHHEGVHERQIAKGDVGPAFLRQPEPLARQPLEGAVLAEMDDGMHARLQRLVERQVLGSGWQVR